MNNMHKKGKFCVLVILSGFMAFFISCSNSFISWRIGQLNNMYISWIPNLFILISAYLIRFVIIDIEKTDQYLKKISQPKDFDFSARRFFNFLFAAMNIGFIATVVIYFNFLLGALFYFFMQITLIFAMSGIISFDLRKIYQHKKLFIIYICNFAFWFTLVPIIFFGLIYRDFSSLLLLPYAYILGCMTAVSLLNLLYIERPISFRLMITIGALIFLISDILIGLIGPDMKKTQLTYFVNPSYIAAISLLTFSAVAIYQHCNIEKN